jgi:hypothetical protein
MPIWPDGCDSGYHVPRGRSILLDVEVSIDRRGGYTHPGSDLAGGVAFQGQGFDLLLHDVPICHEVP